ncbi:hypothetical protein Q4602_11485 [Paraglaciecola chathamensis]|uniref:hypothetical protein n=1 Tax=Paraglaciecola chathamensis TaxID=368405 RepID=UPI002703413F|nr:hypothetical protein [Paraglaciecola chathamensis]MDO6840093.1 hypothetical protein [Paraglaciecola chathamensis]
MAIKPQLDVSLRLIAAVVGGYLVAVAFSFACVPLLVLSHACGEQEAVMVSSMLSYLLYFAVIIVSFCRKSSVLLWRDLALIMFVCTMLTYMLGTG